MVESKEKPLAVIPLLEIKFIQEREELILGVCSLSSNVLRAAGSRNTFICSAQGGKSEHRVIVKSLEIEL